jgi:hypothetical protein
VEIKTGETATVDFALEPKASVAPGLPIEVTMLDENKKPFVDTEFVVQFKPAAEGGPDPTPPPAWPNANAARVTFINGYMRRARTNKDGKFTIYPLPPNKWRISVQLPPSPAAPDKPPIAKTHEITLAAPGGAITVLLNNPANAPKP